MGVHAFIVQLRSLVDHTVMPDLEMDNIGKKLVFESTDNGYLRFTHMRIPRLNMFIKFSRVTRADDKFERLGNELLYTARCHCKVQYPANRRLQARIVFDRRGQGRGFVASGANQSRRKIKVEPGRQPRKLRPLRRRRTTRRPMSRGRCGGESKPIWIFAIIFYEI